MKGAILLYNFAVDTTNDEFHKSHSITRKIKRIATKLDEIEAELRKPEYKATENAPIRAIFVAPEYFFARSAPEHYFKRLKIGWDAVPQDRRGRHYEYKDYIKIRQGLTQLSQQHQQILIIPGTIAWKEEKIAQNIDQPESNTSTSTVNTKPKPSQSSFSSSGTSIPCWGDDRMDEEEEFKNDMRSMGEQEHNIQEKWLYYKREAPDTKALDTQKILRANIARLYGGAGVTHTQKQEIIENVIAKTMTTQGYDDFITALRQSKICLAWNTAYFYLGGKKYWEYSKHSDYQESFSHPEEFSLPLNHTGDSIHDIHGLTIGIEICLDHAYDVLKKYILVNKCKKPAIHLILSACVENKGSQGQVLIHSSSCPDFNFPNVQKARDFCFFKGDSGIQFSVSQETKNIESNNLDFEKFKAKINALVEKQYKFQIIKRSAGYLTVRMDFSSDDQSLKREMPRELMQLVEQLRHVLKNKRIGVDRIEPISLFEVEIDSPMHGEKVEDLLLQAGFKYLPKKIQSRGTLFSSSSLRSYYAEDPHPIKFEWPPKKEEDSTDSPPNIISCALQ